jgi:hypothetical protein
MAGGHNIVEYAEWREQVTGYDLSALPERTQGLRSRAGKRYSKMAF